MVNIHNKKTNAVVTVVFNVDPNNQQSLIDAAINNTEKVMSNKPSFISANFHKNFDKTRVANYAQGEKKEDVEAMFKVPDPKEYTKQILQISSQNWGAYKVVYTSTNS
jgi:hypothetical protein